MTNKTEDKFYFGKHGQKTKFGSETQDVNWQARRWLSQATRIKEEEGLEPFRKRVIKRLEEIIKSTDELIRNPKLEEDYGGWSYKDLEEELLRVAPYSNVARRWLQANLRGGRFSRPGQPDKFGMTPELKRKIETIELQIKYLKQEVERNDNAAIAEICTDISRRALAFVNQYRSRKMARPDQPERFAKISDIKIDTGRDEDERKFSATIDGNAVRGVLYKGWSRLGGWGWQARIEGMAKSPGARMFSSMKDAITYAAERLEASRPGQPERFDASSLDRKGFAEASSSPMLGKLLSEKQMPEGGWRAVETGGGALVISFEDADVAGNFARRVAGSGYSATAPVQAIGRYWNVEVKNG